MKVLLIFDNQIHIKHLTQKLLASDIQQIDLFPLTSDWSVVKEVEQACRAARDDSNVVVLSSAKNINDAVDSSREEIIRWSAEFGNYEIRGKSIIEWFLTPGKEVSTWWFSLLSEKNPYKTDVFFQIAQIKAINETLETNSYTVLLLSHSHRLLRKAIKDISERHSVTVREVSSHSDWKSSKKDTVKEILNRMGFFGSTLKAVACLIRYTHRGLKAKKRMGFLNNRSIESKPLLFISYFPAVDKEAAKRGVLRNKYAIPLQELLQNMNKPMTWIWMYVPIDGWSYDDALDLGKRFAQNGIVNFFLQEFMSPKVFLKSIYTWLIQILKFLTISQSNDHALTLHLNVPGAEHLLSPLFRDSFVGNIGIEGILFFELYKSVWNHINRASHCIYYAELQAWEGALNAAKAVTGNKTKTIGFLHTRLPKNLFNFFHHISELSKDYRPDKLPLPDVIGCNGDICLNRMKEQGYPVLKKVEAIRQLYLKKTLEYSSKYNIEQERQNILLVAGSIDKGETESLTNLLYAAYPKSNELQIWLKGHPSMPFEGILERLGIDSGETGYQIKYQPIGELFREARIVMVGSSTVALEALAANCEVILPVFNDYMFVNPLDAFEGFYTRVYSPEDLRQAIENILGKQFKAQDTNRIKQLISSYWHLDESLDEWKGILKS